MAAVPRVRRPAQGGSCSAQAALGTGQEGTGTFSGAF